MAFETGKQNIDFGIKEVDGKNIFYFNDKEYELLALNDNHIEGFKESFKNEGLDFNEKHYGNGLLRVRGNILDHYGIKDEYLKYSLLNEGLCPYPIGEGVESGTCAGTLDRELLQVPEEMKQEYIKWRIKFFRGIQKMADDGINFPGDEESNKKYSIEMGLCAVHLETILLKYDLEKKIGYIPDNVSKILN